MAENRAIWGDVERDLRIAGEHAVDAERRSRDLAAGRVEDALSRHDRELAVGVFLHHCYSALEAALDRLLRAVDGSSPEGFASHARLIEEAALEKPGLRPAILSPGTAARMHRLRAFRHAFGHAYGQYEYGLAHENVAIAVEVVASVSRDVANFGDAVGLRPKD